MKKLINILIIVFALVQVTSAQTVTKTASKSDVYIGEEFYYTVEISGVSDLSRLISFDDRLDPNLDFIRVEYNPPIIMLRNWGFCAGITDTYNISTRELEVLFDQCSGSALGFDTFSFRIYVKPNAGACNVNTIDNAGQLVLPDARVKSNTSTVNILKNSPLTIQKTFRNLQNNVLTYDIRLTAASGNFDFLDYTNSTPRFFDEFSIPNCISLTGNPSDIEVVYIEDESKLNLKTNASPTVSFVPNTVIMDWALSSSPIDKTSLWYQVKIKIANCTCVGQPNTFFSLVNTAYFEAEDLCGNKISEKEQSAIDYVSCATDPNTGGGTPNIPATVTDSICFTKTLKMDNNDLNLTMKGCTGVYTININNCTPRLSYNKLRLTDVLPINDINIGNVRVIGNATHNMVNGTLTLNNTQPIGPNESVVVEIPFEVSANTPNLPIDNCASLTVDGDDGLNNQFTLNRNDCANTLMTVPNKVTVNTTKTICSSAGSQCGPFSIKENLPGDTVEYSLHFYNYGTAEGNSISLEDVLPEHITIDNINTDVKVYKNRLGRIETCDTSKYKDYTSTVSKRYNSATMKLSIEFGNKNRLNEFTCDGVVQYLVKVKAKISASAPAKPYDNAFVLNFKDESNNSVSQLSNMVTTTVNRDNLVLGNKSHQVAPKDCVNNTQKVRYKILIANMGALPVKADISDALTVPNGISVSSFGNFRECTSTGYSTSLCIAANPFTPTSTTNTGFTYNDVTLQPCEARVITYDVVYNFSSIDNNAALPVCNDAKVKITIEDNSAVTPVLMTQPSFIQQYLAAGSREEQLEIIEVSKAVTANPEIVNNKSPQKMQSYKAQKNIDFGTKTLSAPCVVISDCLPATESGCFTDTKGSFNFSIDSMDRSGNIKTTHTSGQNVTKITYILTDIKPVKTCESETFYWNNKPYIFGCLGACPRTLIGRFYSTSPEPTPGSFLVSQPPIGGPYGQTNKVEYSSLPTAVTQDIRNFKFPIDVNCNGAFEFTMTAIVNFEDCSVCYVIDVFKYNASYLPVFTPIGTRIPAFKL